MCAGIMVFKPDRKEKDAVLIKYSGYYTLFFFVTAIVNQYDTWLTLPPVSIHQWRQADGQALAWHYAQGLELFNPMQFNLFQVCDAHAIGELPLLYWFSGLISQYFQFPAYPLRWISLVLMFAGFWAFGWLLLQRTHKPVLAALGTAVLMSSPMLVYYGVSFLPDAPAFFMLLIMGACLWRAEQRQSAFWIGMAAVFAALAMMLKISMAILPFSLIMTWAMGKRQKQWSASTVWGNQAPFWAIVAMIGVVAWCRWWIFQYNTQHHADYFFADIRPIWWYNGPEILEILKGICFFGLPAYASAGLYLACLGSLILYLKHRKSMAFIWQKSMLFLTFACFSFVLIWFRMLREHDYYAICLMVFPAVILLLGLHQATRQFEERTILFSLGFCWLLGIAHSHYLLDRRLQEAYFPRSTRNLPPQAFLHPDQLKEAGIPPAARFLCPEDPSPNIALLALNRQGWSDYNFGNRITNDTLQKYINTCGLSHLALRDTLNYNLLYQHFFPVRLTELGGWYTYRH
jgi:hypothetical protein